MAGRVKRNEYTPLLGNPEAKKIREKLAELGRTQSGLRITLAKFTDAIASKRVQINELWGRKNHHYRRLSDETISKRAHELELEIDELELKKSSTQAMIDKNNQVRVSYSQLLEELK